MKLTAKHLYDLLPAYYRVLDHEQGGPLEALMAILAREGELVEDNISQLYENWFVETCDEWVVPYIGDLLGVQNIHEVQEAGVFSRRAYVANTLSYRRRKGTAPVLEQLAFDVTGWRSKVVEFFQLLATSQNLNHLRLHNRVTPDLRDMNALDLVHTAFDREAHVVDVRRISTREGLYNIQNIGIYLWRLQRYPMQRVDARKLGGPDGCYTFHPAGLQTHLFNTEQTEDAITHLAEEINVPGPLRRRALFDELEALRNDLVNNRSARLQYFHPDYPPVLEVYLNGNAAPVPPEEIAICNLSDCKKAPVAKTYKEYLPDGGLSSVDLPITVAVDPLLGKLSFPDADDIESVLVHYNYGFSGDVGGGPYDRQESLTELRNMQIDWQVGVSKDLPAVGAEVVYPTLWDAIDAWNNLTTEMTGLITIMDNRTYQEALTGAKRIRIPEGKRLFIIAAEWPVHDPMGTPHRPVGAFNPKDLRPHLLGSIEAEGTAPAGSPNGGSLELNGLLIEGKVSLLNGNLNTCSIRHCTLLPDQGGFEAALQDGLIQIALERSICGPVAVSAEDASLILETSIIDHKSGEAVSIPKGQLAAERCTVFGKVKAQAIDAGNSIFLHDLDIERRQIGCVRFSYVTLKSKTPRRYRCQPELEIQTRIREKEEEGPVPNSVKQAIRQQVLTWLFPVFNASHYGHHAYAQLGASTPPQISAGADNASEMGVFNFLQQPQREANLRTVLKEYLRLGLEAGIIYVT